MARTTITQQNTKKHAGEVKWFNHKAGYGFIKREDGKPDIFVHKTEITKKIPTLEQGESVEFYIKEGRTNIEAHNVQTTGNSTQEHWNPRPKHTSVEQEDTNGKIFACMQAALAISGDNKEHLCQLIPMLLSYNKLPVIKIPAEAVSPRSTRRPPRRTRQRRKGGNEGNTAVHEEEEQEEEEEEDLEETEEQDAEELQRPGNKYEEEEEETTTLQERIPTPQPSPKTPPPKPSPKKKPRTRQNTEEESKKKAWEDEFEEKFAHHFKGAVTVSANTMGWCIPEKFQGEDFVSDCQYREKCRHKLHIDPEKETDRKYEDSVIMCVDKEVIVQQLTEFGEKYNPRRYTAKRYAEKMMT